MKVFLQNLRDAISWFEKKKKSMNGAVLNSPKTVVLSTAISHSSHPQRHNKQLLEIATGNFGKYLVIDTNKGICITFVLVIRCLFYLIWLVICLLGIQI